MDISVSQIINGVSPNGDLTVVGVFTEGPTFGLASTYNDALGGAIETYIDGGDFTPTLGNTFVHFSSSGRVLLVGLGAQAKFDRHSFNKAVDAVASYIKGRQFANVVIRLVEQVNLQYGSALDALKELAQKLTIAQYSFDTFKSDAKPVEYPAAVTVTVDAEESLTYAQDAVNTGVAIANGMMFTMDLGNTPGNVCTPSWLAGQALNLSNDNTTVTVWDLDQIERAGMRTFLSVAQGSVQEPRLIYVEYLGADDKDAAPIALVGKGITFDSGGISIKPSSGMNEMKYDMLGAGTVLGVIKAIQQIGLKINVRVYIAACENMPSGNAIKPGDIVKSMSGITIENNNTDAEGRLILCDVLTLAQQNPKGKPSMIIDMATLTGAICVSLGEVHSGLFTKDDPMAQRLIDAGYGAMDTVWRMPMDKEYDDMLKTNHADVANVGGRDGGSSSAACFLGRFIEDGMRWAHLDIAGTASTNGKNKAATGRPVPLIVQFLLNTVTWGHK